MAKHGRRINHFEIAYHATLRDIETRVLSAHQSVPHKLISCHPTSTTCQQCFELELELIADAGLLLPDDEVVMEDSEDEAGNAEEDET